MGNTYAIRPPVPHRPREEGWNKFQNPVVRPGFLVKHRTMCDGVFTKAALLDRSYEDPAGWSRGCDLAGVLDVAIAGVGDSEIAGVPPISSTEGVRGTELTTMKSLRQLWRSEANWASIVFGRRRIKC